MSVPNLHDVESLILSKRISQDVQVALLTALIYDTSAYAANFGISEVLNLANFYSTHMTHLSVTTLEQEVSLSFVCHGPSDLLIP